MSKPVYRAVYKEFREGVRSAKWYRPARAGGCITIEFEDAHGKVSRDYMNTSAASREYELFKDRQTTTLMV